MNEISKTLVGSIQKFSVEDGPGIRTTVFFKGCPLACKWCHNPELIEPQQQLIRSPNNCIGCGQCIKVCPQRAISVDAAGDISINRDECDICLKCADECYAKALRPVARAMTIDEIVNAIDQDRGFYNHTKGGVTVSGGEILMHGEFVNQLIDAARERNINACIDTSGYGDGALLMEMALKSNVTNILYDMKSIDDAVHINYTGVSNRLILDNLRMLVSDERVVNKIIMRMPLIKGINDTEDIIKRTGQFYKEMGIKSVDLLPYHSLGIGKKRNIGGMQEKFEQPTEKRLEEIEIYFKNEINLKVSVLGRV